MKKYNLLLTLVFLTIFATIPLSAKDSIVMQMALIKKEGSAYILLKNRQKVNVSESLGIIVKPSQSGHLYLVLSDKKKYTLVHHQKVEKNTKTTISNLNKLNGILKTIKNRQKFRLLVFLSKSKLSQINVLKAGSKSKSKWLASEKMLVSKGRSLKSNRIKKPASVAANMRSMNISVKLKKYSGSKNLLSVIYTLYVKKN